MPDFSSSMISSFLCYINDFTKSPFSLELSISYLATKLFVEQHRLAVVCYLFGRLGREPRGAGGVERIRTRTRTKIDLEEDTFFPQKANEDRPKIWTSCLSHLWVCEYITSVLDIV